MIQEKPGFNFFGAPLQRPSIDGLLFVWFVMAACLAGNWLTARMADADFNPTLAAAAAGWSGLGAFVPAVGISILKHPRQFMSLMTALGAAAFWVTGI